MSEEIQQELNPQNGSNSSELNNSETSNNTSTAEPLFNNSGATDMNMLMDINMTLSIEIGRAQIKLNDILNLSKGSVIELDKLSGEPLDVLANGKLIAHGDVISVNGKYGIRLTSLPKKLSNNLNEQESNAEQQKDQAS